ncbi:hypothetical protein B566_EDAN011527 [Ephemera danica]|nr:hypothetical protein B566_EDAN011527 [Ephemera danica]
MEFASVEDIIGVVNWLNKAKDLEHLERDLFHQAMLLIENKEFSYGISQLVAWRLPVQGRDANPHYSEVPVFATKQRHSEAVMWIKGAASLHELYEHVLKIAKPYINPQHPLFGDTIESVLLKCNTTEPNKNTSNRKRKASSPVNPYTHVNRNPKPVINMNAARAQESKRNKINAAKNTLSDAPTGEEIYRDVNYVADTAPLAEVETSTSALTPTVADVEGLPSLMEEDDVQSDTPAVQLQLPNQDVIAVTVTTAVSPSAADTAVAASAPPATAPAVHTAIAHQSNVAAATAGPSSASGKATSNKQRKPAQAAVQVLEPRVAVAQQVLVRRIAVAHQVLVRRALARPALARPALARRALARPAVAVEEAGQVAVAFPLGGLQLKHLAVKMINQDGEYDLISSCQKSFKKFNMLGKEYVLRVHRPDNRSALATEEYYNRIFTDIIRLCKEKVRDTDKVGIVIRSTANPEKPIALSFRNADQLTADSLWTVIYRVVQSNASFLLEGDIHVNVHVVKMPRGSGYVKHKLLPREAFIKKCRGIIEIRNRDQDCLAHAIFIGMQLIHGYKNLDKLQDDEARMFDGAAELYEMAGVDLQDGAGYDELVLFQAILPPDVQLVVHTDLDGKSIFFKGEINQVTHRIHLLLFNGHYDVIRSTVGAFACSYYCEECNMPFASKENHKCKEACSYCLRYPPCTKTNIAITCEECHREFYNKTCFDHHLVNKLSKKNTVCDLYRKCPNCYRTYKKYPSRPAHICGEFFCKT